jgi:hypothetical protein
MSDEKSFSDKLMELTLSLQEASEKERLMFGQLFMIANKMTESGFTQDQLQLIVITGAQCSTNPQLKQLFNLLLGDVKLEPDGEYH